MSSEAICDSPALRGEFREAATFANKFTASPVAHLLISSSGWGHIGFCGSELSVGQADFR
jgi:hypothetical protein